MQDTSHLLIPPPGRPSKDQIFGTILEHFKAQPLFSKPHFLLNFQNCLVRHKECRYTMNLAQGMYTHLLAQIKAEF